MDDEIARVNTRREESIEQLLYFGCGIAPFLPIEVQSVMTEHLSIHLQGVTRGAMTLSDFQEWFLAYAFGPNPVDPDDADAVEDIESAWAEFSGGHISEQAFRRVLQEHAAAPIRLRLMPRQFYSLAQNWTLRDELKVANG